MARKLRKAGDLATYRKEKYKKYDKVLKKIIRKEKNKYFKNQIKLAEGDSKKSGKL